MMTDIAVSPQMRQNQSLAERCTETALAGLAAPSRRMYALRIRQYIEWGSSLLSFTRESVKAWIRSLELAGASPQVRNQSLAAVKRLAYEAGELGWIDSGEASRIQKIKSTKFTGSQTGKWLTADQARALLLAPDPDSAIGGRDLCVLALLMGCGLRRAEAVDILTSQLKLHNSKYLLTNLNGKGGRVRSVSAPAWAAQLIENWKLMLPMPASGEILTSTKLLRSFHLDGTINGSLSTAAVFDIVQRYGGAIGIPDLAPHDLRRTHAKLARLGGCPLETIQHTLGHADVKTTMAYIRTGEEANAGDWMGI